MQFDPSSASCATRKRSIGEIKEFRKRSGQVLTTFKNCARFDTFLYESRILRFRYVQNHGLFYTTYIYRSTTINEEIINKAGDIMGFEFHICSDICPWPSRMQDGCEHFFHSIIL